MGDKIMKNKLFISLLVLLCLLLASCTSNKGFHQQYSEDEAIEEFENDTGSVMVETPNSSCFSEIGWYGGDLYVVFRDSGAEYVYFDVPRSVYNELEDSDSPGKYYNAEIKGDYDCEKVS